MTDNITALRAKGAFGAYVGRLNPMHVGHQIQIRSLIETFGDRHLIMIGSSNNPTSIRHLFNYSDRSDFIRTIFPDARLAPLPDFNDDGLWLSALDDLIRIAGGDPRATVFLGGCEEDIAFYNGTGRTVHITNRFDGGTPNVSGTEVRDALIGGRSLDSMLDDRIIPLVQERFALRWDELRKK